MADTFGVRLSRRQQDSIEAMTESGEADNQSEALRTAIDVGLHELGYRGGKPVDNSPAGLQMAARRFRDAFALLGVMWVGLSFVMPLELRALAIVPFASSLACVGIDQAVESWGDPLASLRRSEAVADGGEKE
jgi:hypothetical protein